MADTLVEYLGRYFRCNLRIRNEQTRKIYRLALKNLESVVGKPPTLDDLTDDNCAAMMSLLVELGRAIPTVNERRARLHAFWSWLAKRNIVTQWPTTPALSEPRRTPKAWTKDQLVELIRTCSRLEGNIGTIPAKYWWTSLHLALWDTGERISALLGARWEHLEGDWLHLPAEVRKGQKKDGVYRLSLPTVAMLEKIRSERPMIWPWPYVPMYLWVKYKKIRTAAGLADDRWSAFHRMRRSVASHLKAAGGDATEALGHEDRSTTERSYIDPRISGRPQPKDWLFRIDDEHEIS